MRKRKLRTDRLLILAGVLILALFLVVKGISTIGGMIHNMADRSETAEPTPEPTPTPVPTPTPIPLSDLEKTIQEKTAEYGGDWSVWIEDMTTFETLSYNNHPMVSASLIKLFTAGRYYQACYNGEIKKTDKTDQMLDKMIRISDNNAWKSLETYIGHGTFKTGYNSVTKFAQEFGCPDTGRRLVTEGSKSERNMTSAASVGKVLDAIYRGTYVSKECSEKILDLMKQQYWTYKIPKGLPEGIKCANKTGELNSVQNDSAIVYGAKKDYILVIMTDKVPGGKAVDDIIEMSSIIYQFLNSDTETGGE